MKPILITTKTWDLNERLKQKSVNLPQLNEILELYNSMNLEPITGQELQQLISTPSALIFNKITGGEPITIKGFQILPHKGMDLIVKPNGYENLINSIQKFKDSVANWSHNIIHLDVINNEVCLKQSVIDTETENCKVYITTDKEKRVYDFLQAVIESARENFGDGKLNLGTLVTDLVYVKDIPGGSKSYEINAQIKGWGYNRVF